MVTFPGALQTTRSQRAPFDQREVVPPSAPPCGSTAFPVDLKAAQLALSQLASQAEHLVFSTFFSFHLHKGELLCVHTGTQGSLSFNACCVAMALPS